MKKIVITSGFFNPLHTGHASLFREAKKLGDFLLVIINNDSQVKVKGSIPFMTEKERLEIIKEMKHVDEVLLSIDKDITVAKSLELVAKKYMPIDRQVWAELYFAKGGDRNINNIPESERLVCKKFNIKVINNVGGAKVQSSSKLLRNTINSV